MDPLRGALVRGRAAVAFTAGVYVAGMAAAFLLGNLPNARQGRLGLAIVVGSAATIVYNIPDHAAGTLLFIPLFFGLGWLAGFAVRERAEQAEAAEERALLVKRERDAAMRIAVAEERARIARELHDVVAHAVSVMVLQVGAVRHKLPAERSEDREALENVERPAARRSPRCAGSSPRMRPDGDDDSSSRPSRAWTASTHSSRRSRRAGLPVRGARRGRPGPAAARDRPLGLPDRAGGTDERAQARARRPRRTSTVRYGTDELRIEVRDDGAGAATSDGLGHGLVGIRERVKIYGGEMSAGARRRRRLRARRASAARRRPAREHPRPRRRRPVDGARRVPHAALRRGGHRGRRRGVERARGGRQGGPLQPDRGADGHPHARARRARGDPADPRRRRRRRGS